MNWFPRRKPAMPHEADYAKSRVRIARLSKKRNAIVARMLSDRDQVASLDLMIAGEKARGETLVAPLVDRATAEFEAEMTIEISAEAETTALPAPVATKPRRRAVKPMLAEVGRA